MSGYQRKPCRACGRGLGAGNPVDVGYHLDCEPLTCTCAVPRPDGIGECAGCHRLVLSHSWHDGRPVVTERGAA